MDSEQPTSAASGSVEARASIRAEAAKTRGCRPCRPALTRGCRPCRPALARGSRPCRPGLEARSAPCARASSHRTRRCAGKIPRRCAAASARDKAPPASMEEPALTGARRRGAPQTRRSSRLLSCGITGARRRRAPGARGSSRLQRGLRSGRATRGRLWIASCAAFASPLAPAPYRAGHIRSGALRRLGTARRRPASHLRVQRRAAHTLHRLPFTSSCWTRWKPAAAHRARRQAHGDAPPPHGSLIALTFARGGVALRLAACSRSLAGRLPGPARKARGQRPRLPGRLPRTLLGRRSHRSRCLPAESVCGSCALCHFVARV